MDDLKRIEEEIEYIFEEVQPLGAEERSAQLDDLEKLLRLKEIECRIRDRESEKDSQRKIDLLKIGVEVGGLLLSVIWMGKYSQMVREGYAYEREGVISSPTFKRILNDMRFPKFTK